MSLFIYKRSALALQQRILVLSGVASLACFGILPVSAVQLLPGVYGYGLDRTNNRAGFVPTAADPSVIKVVRVKSLADDGIDTLRKAVGTTTTNPVVVIFDVSGVIELESPLVIRNSNLTIAGQTAPAPGIALHGSGVLCKANNVLIQHLRVRPGDRWADSSTANTTTNRDAVRVEGNNKVEVISNVVFDHCTFGWSLDEMSSVWNRWDNVTFNKCLFAEPLHNSIHLDEMTFDVDPATGVQNFPWQVENLSYTRQGFSTVDPVIGTPGIDGRYDSVNTDSVGDFIDYTVPIIPNDVDRGFTHLVLVGVTGPERAQFKVQLLPPIVGGDFGEIIDQYSATPRQHTYVSQQDNRKGFIIPAQLDHLTVRLTVTGRNPANTKGWKLGIDQISLSEGHGMGPLWSSGSTSEGKSPGKMTVIGSAIAHIADRGPWANAQQFYFTNNVIYDRSWKFMKLGHILYWPDDSIHAALIGNAFIEGASLLDGSFPSPVSNPGVPPHTQIYQTDNIYNPGDLVDPDHPTQHRTAPAFLDPTFSSGGFVVTSDPTVKADGLEGFFPLRSYDSTSEVLRSVGARPVDRDKMELRIVDEIKRGSATTATAARPGTLKHSVAGAGGWPVYTQRANALNLPANGGLDPDGDGYTNLEEWLHDLAAQVETKAAAISYSFEADPLKAIAKGWIVDPAAPGNRDAGSPNNWQVAADGTKVFQQQSLLDDSPAYLPGTNWSGNQAITAKVKLLSTNGVNRFARVYARYQDMSHAYYVTLRNPSVVNETTPSIELKKVNGPTLVLTFDASSRFPIAIDTTYSVKLSVTKTSPTVISLSATVTNLSNPAETVTLTGTDTSAAGNSTYTLGTAAIGTYKASASFDDVAVTP